MRLEGHVACMRDEKARKISVGKPERKRCLGRIRHRWEDNIKNTKETGREVVHWIRLL
jgi:hypothetical protein